MSRYVEIPDGDCRVIVFDGNTKSVIDKCYDSEDKGADVAPVVRGEWKLYGNDDDSGMSYWCTACNFHLSEDLFYSGYKNGKWIENGVFKYCPYCGAKMDGGTP